MENTVNTKSRNQDHKKTWKIGKENRCRKRDTCCIGKRVRSYYERI